MPKFLTNNPLVVLDIGASGGIKPRWEKLDAEHIAVLCEPDPREFDNLSATLPTNYRLISTALSDHKGKTAFNLCRKQMCSSILKSNFEKLRFYHQAERFDIIDNVELDVDTLDNALKGVVDRVDFIKIDAEASELFILKGASNTLKNVLGMEIEVSFFPIRKDQPLFEDVQAYVRQAGFELIDIRGDYWKRNIKNGYQNHRKGQMIWGDVLYFRSPEYLFNKFDGLTADIIERQFFVYMAYGYHDLALTLLGYANERQMLSAQLLQSLHGYIKARRKNS